MPAHFQFIVENALCDILGKRPLPVVVYLDDIAVYGGIQEQVLEDTLEAIKHLTAASFMLDLHISQLVQAVALILRNL